MGRYVNEQTMNQDAGVVSAAPGLQPRWFVEAGVGVGEWAVMLAITERATSPVCSLLVHSQWSKEGQCSRPTGTPSGIEYELGRTSTRLQRLNKGLKMIYMRACIRCKGDMTLAPTDDGPELWCFHCGFYLDQKRARTLLKKSVVTGAAAAALYATPQPVWRVPTTRSFRSEWKPAVGSSLANRSDANAPQKSN